jgi:formylglycine-generating enzyme required for sulfatase activity
MTLPVLSQPSRKALLTLHVASNTESNRAATSSTLAAIGAIRRRSVWRSAARHDGRYDMIGNLAEWVDGCASPSYAAMRADGSDAGGDCARRMVRGGSWGTNAGQVRSAERIRYKPTEVDDSIGIRVAKSLP